MERDEDTSSVEIRLITGGSSARHRGLEAASLLESLTRQDPSLQLRRLRELEGSQDTGTIVGVALAAPSVVAVASGIKEWLKRQHNSKISVTDSDGTILVESLTSSNAVDALRAILARKTAA